MEFLNGYKTYIGAAIRAIGAFLANVPELASLSEPFITLGEALIVVGLAHKGAKVEKASK